MAFLFLLLGRYGTAGGFRFRGFALGILDPLRISSRSPERVPARFSAAQCERYRAIARRASKETDTTSPLPTLPASHSRSVTIARSVEVSEEKWRRACVLIAKRRCFPARFRSFVGSFSVTCMGEPFVNKVWLAVRQKIHRLQGMAQRRGWLKKRGFPQRCRVVAQCCLTPQ